MIVTSDAYARTGFVAITTIGGTVVPTQKSVRPDA